MEPLQDKPTSRPRDTIGLVLAAMICVGMVATILRIIGCIGPEPAEARLRKPTWKLDSRPTVQQLADVVGCMARQQAPGTFKRRYEVHYTPKRLQRVSRAIWGALDSQRWPMGLTSHRVAPLFTAILYQQSKFVSDAVSKYNRDENGQRIWIGNCRKRALTHPGERCLSKAWVWAHPKAGIVRRLDLGMFQNHVATVLNQHPDLTLEDLKQPEHSTRYGAVWLNRRMKGCADWLKKPPKRCGRFSATIACRCKRTWVYLGAPYHAGSNTDTLISKYAPMVRRCVDQVMSHKPPTPTGQTAGILRQNAGMR